MCNAFDSLLYFLEDGVHAHTLELRINSDTGVTITTKENEGNYSDNDVILKGKEFPSFKTSKVQHAFSFKNAMEFRCITQAELEILENLEEKNAPCAEKCIFFIYKT